jgi:hypothetical protein
LGAGLLSSSIPSRTLKITVSYVEPCGGQNARSPRRMGRYVHSRTSMERERGARGGNRTPTPLQKRDFESRASTSSATRARGVLIARRPAPRQWKFRGLGSRSLAQTYRKIDGRARLLVGEACPAAIYGLSRAGGTTRSQRAGGFHVGFRSWIMPWIISWVADGVERIAQWRRVLR